MQQILLQAMRPGEDNVADISGVTQADLSFVQSMESARSHAAKTGGSLRLSAPAPDAVMAILSQAGLLGRRNPTDVEFWTLGVPKA